MTAEDVRIIFNNVGEIAQFAADLVPQIEEAIGSALKGGTGDDHVGTLFAEMVRLSCHNTNFSILKWHIPIGRSVGTQNGTALYPVHH